MWKVKTNNSLQHGLSERILIHFCFSFIVMTTSAGIMDHEEARRKNTGGKILGYFY